MTAPTMTPRKTREPTNRIDLRKRLRYLYEASPRDVGIVNVPPMKFLMLDGAGDPNWSPEFGTAVEALYAIAYALKAKLKSRPAGVDYAMMPLEGLWWMSGMRHFDLLRRENWKWTLMIMEPDAVDADLFIHTVVELEHKRPLPRLREVRLERFSEGRAAQLMHVGPFSGESETLTRLHGFIRSRGFRMQGKHHEIYLSDPRRTAIDRLRTLIRQPLMD